MIVMTCAAAKYIWAMSALSSLKRVDKVCVACRMLVVVVTLPSWYMSTRFWGTGSMNGGCLRVVGFVADRLASGVRTSPIYGIRA